MSQTMPVYTAIQICVVEKELVYVLIQEMIGHCWKYHKSPEIQKKIGDANILRIGPPILLRVKFLSW